MRELFRGTVTLLFTDIEGSTRLLHTYGRDAYVASLELHRRLLRDVFADHDGVEVEMQGDSFFFAFRAANAAAAAAAAGQRVLASADWGSGPPIGVRMGLHTGEPTVSDGLYAGLDVHRAARVMAAAHGGQVLLSARTADLVQDALPPGARLRPLGRFLLKDFDGGELLTQLELADTGDRFRPPRAERQPAGALRYAPRPVRRHPVVALAAAALVAAGVVVPVVMIHPAGIEFQANALVELDARSGRALTVVPVGDTPSAVAPDRGALWVANSGEATVSRVNVQKGRVVRTTAVPGTPVGLASAGGSLWVLNSDLAAAHSSLSRIDLRYHEITSSVQLPSSALIGSGAGVTWDGRSIWTVTQAGDAFEVSPSTSRILARVPLGDDPIAIVAAGGSVWAANRRDGTVSRIDRPGVVTSTISVGAQPSALAAGAGAVWVADAGEDAVRRIDPKTGSVVATIRVGRRPQAIAASPLGVWVGNSGDQSLSRIDPRTNRVTKTLRLAYDPAALAIVGDRVWVALQRPPPRQVPQPRAGTLRLLTATPGVIDSLDPALAYTMITWQIEYATCARLYNQPDAPPPVGYHVVPEVAAGLPTVGKDGRTYTIPIRRGFRFSPPTNQVVTARSFKYAIERALNPKTHSFAANFLADVDGARAFERGHAQHIAGLIARPHELVVRLVRPAGDLPARLAMPFFCPVPIGTPLDFKGLRNIPSAGPYYIASYVPNGQIVLRRNPNYHGSRPRRSPAIVITPAASESQAIRDVELGRDDLVIDASGRVAIPPRYRRRLVRVPEPAVHYFALNTARPTFSDPDLRRAFALAIDRTALSRFDDNYVPTESLLPPGFPGEWRGRAFRPHGDLVAARKLMHGRRRSAVFVTCSIRTCIQRAAELARQLARIGVHVRVEPLPSAAAFQKVSASGAHFDITDSGWAADYIDPGDFLVPLASAAGIKTTQSSNVAYYTTDRVEQEFEHAQPLLGAQRTKAFEQIERSLRTSAVPYVAYATQAIHLLVSSRIGCAVASPVYGLDLGRLCIKRR